MSVGGITQLEETNFSEKTIGSNNQIGTITLILLTLLKPRRERVFGNQIFYLKKTKGGGWGSTNVSPKGKQKELPYGPLHLGVTITRSGKVYEI